MAVAKQVTANTKQNEAITCELFSRNDEAGYMVSSFRNLLHDQMRLIFSICPETAQKNIPNDLLADHSLFLAWQWAAVKHLACTKEQAHQYLACLVGKVAIRGNMQAKEMPRKKQG